MILIVDDDPAIRRTLKLILESEGFDVDTAATATEAMARVRAYAPRLVLLDMNLTRSTTGDQGLTMLQQIKLFRPLTPIILMTAWGSIDLAVKGMRLGACDFITKPWDNASLLRRIDVCINRSDEELNPSDFDRSLIIGKSPQIMQAIAVMRRVAATEASVLITGENGTGKELVAETLHRNSRRRNKPFVKVNLGGIPDSLFESEMFGHKKGAFTGAVSDRKGRFEIADGGTIFLDEIGELSAASQVKLLRVIQEQTFEPLGSSQTRKVDVRIISATNAPLPLLVADKSFREDLFYRLNLIGINLPPLRERASDIPLLVNHFAAGRATFTPEAMDLLKARQWPGNIRELKNAVERAIIFNAPERTVDAASLRLSLPAEMPITQSDPLSERAVVERALAQNGGNISRTAASLGLTRQALYRRMEKFGL